eukprot:5862347-Amphidinium_carterae.1
MAGDPDGEAEDVMDHDALAGKLAADAADVLAGVEDRHDYDGNSGTALQLEKVDEGMLAEPEDYE